MEKLTVKQEQYLLFFAVSKGKDRNITNAAEYFGIKKPTVFNMVKNLVERGMVDKKYDGEILLTDKGQEYINVKYNQFIYFSRFMQQKLGISPSEADYESMKMTSTLSDNILEKWANYETRRNISNDFLQENIKKVEQIQDLPFTVYKKDGKSVSMGDEGFEKPAYLHENEKKKWICIKALQVKYKPKFHNMLKGKLSGLWYEHEAKWYEVVENKDKEYIIPFSAVNTSLDENVGILRVRARATVGRSSMPESEAIIKFDLSDLKGF